MSLDIPFIDRYLLGQVFTDPRALLAFEGIQRAVINTLPNSVDQAQASAEAAANDAAAAQASADAAAASANTIAGAAFVVLAASSALSNERILSGGTGVTLDTATAGQVKVLVDALAILNAAAVVLTQDLTAPNVTATGTVKGASLETTQTPTAAVTAQSHYVPIVLGGVTYKLLLAA